MATATPAKKTTTASAIDIIEVSQGEVQYAIIGETPLIMEAMSEKARQELLLPRGRLNATAKATNLKHDPLAEYRASAYVLKAGPTALGMPATAFKDAIRTAALDLAGISKSEIGRLTYVEGSYAPIWGVPELFMSIVRSADIKRTPDVRTRAILPRWATTIVIRFVEPKMNERAISRLLAAAGMTAGVGGWRQEKGSGNFGLFRICAADDPEYLDIIAAGGRAAQEEALQAPQAHDEETARLLDWYETELGVRRLKGSAAAAAA